MSDPSPFPTRFPSGEEYRKKPVERASDGLWTAKRTIKERLKLGGFGFVPYLWKTFYLYKAKYVFKIVGFFSQNRYNRIFMNKPFKRVLKSILPLALGGGVLFWVYRDFDFTTVGTVLCREMNWGWMSLSLMFGMFSHIIRGWRWKQTLEPMGAFPKTDNCVNAIFVSYAANLVIPRLGEISRCGVLARYEKIPFAKSLGTVVTERLIDALCVAVITVITLGLQWKVFHRFFEETGIGISGMADRFTSAHVYVILGCTVAAVMLLYYLLRRLPVFGRIKGVIYNVWEGITSLKKVKNLSLFTAYTLFIWFCYFMHFYIAFFCFSFTEQLSVGAALAMFTGGAFAVMAPTPAGAGPWHFVIISMMSLYGVSVTNAGIFALVVHGIQTFLVVLLGIYGMILLPFTNKIKNQ
ncbi:hypothetical protein EZS27_027017 [termite gut metagenome]|uniref:Dolichol-P-glucose synthetase n=1 Tax=termite gut metagenome TaxID=433724 RepID=A0A5J4QR83_9ZZZZ